MSKKVDDVPIQNGVLSPKKIEDKGKDDKCLKKLSKLPDFDDGLARRNYTCFTLVECLDRSYTNELVTYDVTFPSNTHLNSLRLYDAVNQIFVIYQLSEVTYHKIIDKDCKKKGEVTFPKIFDKDCKKQGLVRAKISFWVDKLDAKSKRLYVLFHDTGNGFAPPKFPELKVEHTNLSQELVEIGNKTIGIRLWGGVQSYSSA